MTVICKIVQNGGGSDYYYGNGQSYEPLNQIKRSYLCIDQF